MRRLLLLLTGLLFSISSLQAQNPGELDLSFNPNGINTGTGANQVVHASVRQSDGKIISVGNFTSYNGIVQNRIIRLNPDGTLDPTFNIGTGANARIWTVTLQPDGKIIIGGDFTQFNGVARSGIARLNSDGSVDSNFTIGTGFNGRVYTIFIQPDGKILVGGDFIGFNGVSRPYSARLETTGTLDLSYFPGFQGGGVRSIVSTSDGSIYLAGGFTFSIVKLTSSGAPVGNWCQCAISGLVFSLFVQSDDKLLIGGKFQFVSPFGSRYDLVRINPIGEIDNTFAFTGLTINNYILSISPQEDGKILIAGNFQTQRSNVARLNSNGSLDFSFITAPNAPLWNVLALPDGKAIVGGEFTSINGIARNYLAQLNSDGSYEVMGSGADFTIYSLAVQENQKILVGGSFTSYNGAFSSRITRLNSDGSRDASFNTGTGTNGGIVAKAIQTDGKILVGGNFTTFNNISRNRIARLNPDGSNDGSFNIGTGANGVVRIIFLQPDGKIIIGGDFTSFNGVSRNYIARLNSDGSLDTSFSPGTGANERVYALNVQSDGKILIGGNFTSYGGTTRNYLARLNSNGSIDATFAPSSGANSTVWTISLQSDGKIIIGGNFTTYNGISRNSIARLDTNGALDTSFNPGTGAVSLVLKSEIQPNGKIIIAGQFTNYDGITRGRVARINSDGTLDASFNSNSGANNHIWSLALQADGNVLIGGDFTGYSNISRVRIARVYGDPVEEQDTQAPVPTVENLTQFTAQCIVNFSDLSIPTATDNLDGTIQGTSNQNIFPITQQGSYNITWTYTDAAGNSSTKNQTIIVDDTTAPVPTLAELPVISGQCSATVTAPTATDTCEGTITGTTSDPIEYSEQGTYLISWTYDDGNGNTVTQEQNVIVDDTTAPVPTLTQLAVVSGQCSVEVTSPTADDPCEGVILGTTTDPTSYTEQGTYLITWTYDDGNGNTETQEQTVIVDDTIAPVPTLTQLAVVSGQCSATVTAPTSTDTCEGTITGTTEDPIEYSEQGTYLITWTFDDGNGNTTNQQQTVVVDDTTAPVPTLATLPTITGQCSATVTAPTATDTCEGTITGTTEDPTSYSEQGTFTITWTFDDGNGNTTTQEQTVIVDDTTAPVPTLTQLPVASGQCAVEVTSPTANDNCEGVILGTTTDPTSYTEQGTYFITWTYYDGNGNPVTQEQTVVVDDTTAPVPTVADLPVFSGQCSVEVTAPTATDTCEGTITGTTEDPTSYSEQGTYSITWTYDDGNGNITTQKQTVIVDDTIAPVPTLTQLVVVNGQCSVTVAVPTANDACKGTITGTTTDPTSYTEQGTYTIAWTFADGNGNATTQEQTVIVDDTTAPVPTLAELPVISGQCSVTVIAPTATDICEGTITGTTTDPTSYSEQGTYLITWTYDDGNGNTSTQVQTVIVDDTTAPVATLGELPVISGQCSATVTAPTATDICKGTITGTTEDPTNYSEQGTYTITWTYDDGNGNIATQEQTVIVDDTTAPVPTVTQLAVVSGQCSVEVTSPTANDNCEGGILGTTEDPTKYTEQGTYTITWTYDDGNGNIATQEQTVIVDDTTAPVPTVTQLAVVSGQCSLEVTSPTANDTCEGTITGTTEDPTSYTEQGTYLITWTYDDGNGNTTTQEQTVIVDDTIAPVPTLAELPVISDQCSVTVTAPTATDTCEGTITGTTEDPLEYSEQGTYLITWTFDDGNGNIATQEQTVIVDDTIAPVPTLTQLSVGSGQCSVEVNAPTASDTCEGIITGTTEDPLEYSEQGTYTITWTYDDGNGNTATQEQTVIVDDTSAPVPTLAELPVISGQCSAMVTAPTATDNCEGTIIGTTEDPIEYSEQGTYHITWTYDDGNGNATTQEQTVIVDDTTAPVPTLTQLAVFSGQCAVEVTSPTANDNCEGVILGTTTDPTSYTEQGTFTITWTFDDGNGNITTQDQTVIVDDTIAPVPTLAELPVISGQCSVMVTAPTATDICEGTITGTTEDPTSYSEQGTYLILWTYDDRNGNTTTQEQTVIVDDETNPGWNTIVGSLDRTLYCGQDNLFAQAQNLAPVANDNCGHLTMQKTIGVFVPTGPNGAGTITNTWVATDGNSNLSEEFTQVITIAALEIDASASGTPVQLGSTATLSAIVTPIVGGVTVNFYLDGLLKGSAVTNTSGIATLSVSGLQLDVYKVTAEVGSGCSESIAYLPVYDPNGSFVTGGGWINSPAGAYTEDPSLVGKASFGFVSKYKKGSNQVDGNTEFQFKAGNLNFKSTLHEAGTLVISGKKATYRGDGTINGVSGFRFKITAIDGNWNGGTLPDQFRIKIWGSNGVIYDNGLGADDNSEVATTLGGGSIVIHEAKGKGTKRVSAELITVDWNTPLEIIKKKVDLMSATWFDSRKLALTLDPGTYDPLTPGFYELKADLVENEFFELDEPIAIQVLVQDKPKALDIEISGNVVAKDVTNETVIGTLSTLDPADDIHSYSMDANADLEIQGNQLIWKGTNLPAAEIIVTVFSTDRAGQTISKEIKLSRELKPGEFFLYPNPAVTETNVMLDLDQSATIAFEVYDAFGRLVIQDEAFKEGSFTHTLKLDGLAPGMYMVQLKVGNRVMTKRLIKN
jgi:uncharacterized delta-60 repeat protein